MADGRKQRICLRRLQTLNLIEESPVMSQQYQLTRNPWNAEFFDRVRNHILRDVRSDIRRAA